MAKIFDLDNNPYHILSCFLVIERLDNANEHMVKSALNFNQKV